jgi:isocitrate/isopropylmalate dehydrogenase
MLLRHLGDGAAADRVEGAISEVCEQGVHVTADLGGSASTGEVTDAVLDALRPVSGSSTGTASPGPRGPRK